VLKYCSGCVGIVKNWNRRERCPTDAKQGDWFVFDVIRLHSFYHLMFFIYSYVLFFGQFSYCI